MLRKQLNPEHSSSRPNTTLTGKMETPLSETSTKLNEASATAQLDLHDSSQEHDSLAESEKLDEKQVADLLLKIGKTLPDSEDVVLVDESLEVKNIAVNGEAQTPDDGEDSQISNLSLLKVNSLSFFC